MSGERNCGADLRAGAFTCAVTHMFGTCRMGGDPGDSVVRPDFRHHTVDRLYVADSSVFPTNLGVNPQVPIMAAAARIRPIAFMPGRSFGRRWSRDAPSRLSMVRRCRSSAPPFMSRGTALRTCALACAPGSISSDRNSVVRSGTSSTIRSGSSSTG